MPSPASQFIDESIKHPDWLRVIESGQANEMVRLANDQGFACSIEELKQAATELLKPGESSGDGTPPDQGRIDEAATGLSDLEGEMGYGDDTGYAALYGVAGAILKM